MTERLFPVVFTDEDMSFSVGFRQDSQRFTAEMETGHGGGELYPATTSTLGGIIVGDDLLITREGRLSVDKTDTFSADNTKPVTAAAVYGEIGNINALLATI